MLSRSQVSADDVLWHGYVPWYEVKTQLIKNPYDWAKKLKGGPIALADEKLHPDVSIVLTYPPHWHGCADTRTLIAVFQHTNIITVRPADSPAPVSPDRREDSNMSATVVPDMYLGYWHYAPKANDKLCTILETWVDNPIDTLVGAQPPRNSHERSTTLYRAISDGDSKALSPCDQVELRIDSEKPLTFIFTWNVKTDPDAPPECVKSGGMLSSVPNNSGGIDYTIDTNQIWYYSYAASSASPLAASVPAAGGPAVSV
jgi:hypothetical protein